MAEETHLAEAVKRPNKRHIGKTKGSKARKKARKMPHSADGNRAMKPRKIDPKMKKLYRKRAREYDSEDDEKAGPLRNDDGSSSGDEAEGNDTRKADNGFSDGEEDDEIQPGITKLAEGCNAFRLAFRSIIKKTVSDDVLVSNRIRLLRITVWFVNLC